MVSSWAAIVPAVLIAFLSFFVPWTGVASSNGLVLAHLAPTDLASAVGETYGPCGCPPWATLAQNSSLVGTPFDAVQLLALEALVPALVSLTLLAAGAWTFPLAFLLALLSLLRWRIMIFSGLLFIASGALWIVGMAAETNHVNSMLAQWAGQAPGYIPPTVDSSFGPYLPLLTGVILTVGYLLVKRDVWASQAS